MAEGHTQLVLNLETSCTTWTAAGWARWWPAMRGCAKAGGNIRLAETTHGIKDLLAITRLVTVFE